MRVPLEGLLKILRCPKCLQRLIYNKNKIKLKCLNCREEYFIYNGMLFFGYHQPAAGLRESEIDAEFRWHFCNHSYEEHYQFAQWSFRIAEDVIRRVKKECPFGKVLDAGAGSGCHSWQFSRHGYEVVAAEMSPELLAISDVYCTAGIYFYKLVTDCTILPLEDKSFDIIFCKELAHHVENLPRLFREFHRILKPNGILAMVEPTTPIIRVKTIPDLALEAGLTHQSYTIKDYLKALQTNDFRIFAFKHYKSSVNRSSIINRLNKYYIDIFRPTIWGSLSFPKWFRAYFLGGSIALIARRGEKVLSYSANRALTHIPTKLLDIHHNEILMHRAQQVALLDLLNAIHTEENLDRRIFID